MSTTSGPSDSSTDRIYYPALDMGGGGSMNAGVGIAAAAKGDVDIHGGGGSLSAGGDSWWEDVDELCANERRLKNVQKWGRNDIHDSSEED